MKKSSYDKSSFFDSISCEATEKKEKPSKEDMIHQRKVDQETFGTSNSHHRNFYRPNPNNPGRGNYQRRYTTNTNQGSNSNPNNNNNNNRNSFRAKVSFFIFSDV